MLTASHINPPIKAILRAFLRVNDADVRKVPMNGPLIIATNHINWLDAPLGFSHLHPRPLTAFAKIETWDSLPMRVLFNAWDAIPITRGEVDFTAFRKAEAALKKGRIIAVAPEGTRSGDGSLKKGFPGIVFLALRAGVPILPFVFYGNENVGENLRRYRRTEITLKAGPPFRLLPNDNISSKDMRQELTDAVMFEIARLLPESYRGYYSDIDNSYQKYLQFI